MKLTTTTSIFAMTLFFLAAHALSSCEICEQEFPLYWCDGDTDKV
jgi:hypothetical protein